MMIAKWSAIVSVIVALCIVISRLYLEHVQPKYAVISDGIAAFKKGEYARAANILMPYAEKGNKAAQIAMATAYAFRYGVTRERYKAKTLFESSTGEKAVDFYVWVATAMKRGTELR